MPPHGTGEATDEALVARAVSGSRSAFATLVGRYQDRMYRLAFRMSHNASDAEEITQETFLLAHRGIGSFHGDSRFRTWLYRICVNQALMQRRAARRRPLHFVQPSDLSTDAELYPTADGPPDGADELLHRRMLIERVRVALGLLDDSQRAALVLRDLEELSADEAAAVLGVSPDAVRQRAHRARSKLRELLGDVLRASGG